jgi:ATP-binding cassette subfamily B multidrug efflux pump
LYIFDDSFSALDYKTDAFIRREIKKISEDKIIIIVAQRVTTIMDADKILLWIME